jgi:5-(carboxyamino)imidazole ribonucleotide mutase
MKTSFTEQVRARRGCAVIMAGSGSDGPWVEKIAAALKEYGIPCEVRICSAHKTPEQLMRLIAEYNRLEGPLTFVAVAGGTDALSGVLGFHALNPVISCPPGPVDARGHNQSCLDNPPGSANAYIARPRNVAKFIAQLYAPFNPAYRKALIERGQAKIAELAAEDARWRPEGGV